MRRSLQGTAKKCAGFRQTRHYRRRRYIDRLVASGVGLWDSDARSHESFSVFMRLLSPIVRMSMRASAIFVLALFAASSAEAAHTRHTKAQRLCSPQTTTLTQLKRQPHKFGGPVAPPSQRVLIGLTDPTTRIARATETDNNDNDQAIQNDAPATSIAADLHVTVLTPLGLLVGSVDARPRVPAFSPKS